ncbi:hypothetical protein MMC30_007827 [Trapelia coarctata]|nr:hypothetical protein [Trapelia coarctata]
MPEDGELPILEYARFYGLATDHHKANGLSTLVGKQAVDPVSDETALFEISAAIATPAPERLTAGKEAVAFLSSIRPYQLGPFELSDELVPKIHRIRDLKLEEPLLRSDHILDMQQFGGWIIPDLVSERLPLEKVNDEEDEGLRWPARYHELRSGAAKRSELEKLSVSKDVLLYLKELLQQHEEGTAPPRFDEDVVVYKRSTALNPITPPLLPVSPDILPYIPSSDVCNLELLSDQTSPYREELHEIEETMMRNDALIPRRPSSSGANSDSTSTRINSDNVGDIYSPLKDLKEPPILPSFKRKRPEDLKVDGPLTPPRFEQPPPWQRKKVSFQEALVEIIPDLPSPIPSPEETSTDDIDRFFDESIRPIAEEAERRLEQEQLQEADTTQRVKVPVMDFSRPLAPWKVFAHSNSKGSGRKEQLRQMKTEHLGKSFWPLSGEVERSLRWAPFPTGLAKIAVQEDIEGDEKLADVIVRPECIDHTTLVWKQDGLRVFDESESDTDEIEYGQFPETVDFQSLLRKRKLDLIEDVTLSKQSYSNQIDRVEDTIPDPLGNESRLPFSAVEAIEDFMSIRSGEGKRKKLMESSYFSASEAPSGSEAPATKPVATRATTETNIARPKPVRAIHQAPPPPLLPQLMIPKDRRSFIISSSFLADRSLFRLIQSLHPTADFIERDFALHAMPTPSVPLGPPRPPRATALANEADILLSPSTGLITTTLQKIAQRPLPGSTSLSPIFNRIFQCAPCYEALFILVTDGRPSASTTTGLGSTSTESPLTNPSLAPLLSLHGFLSTLPLSNNPSIILIPTPAPSNSNPLVPLATHIVHLMVTHSLPHGITTSKPPNHGSSDLDCKIPEPIRLRQEETNWELFLRRAGMNAYAAQGVLASLRPPVLDRRWERLDMGSRAGRLGRDEEAAETKRFGLGAFVRMSEAERMRRFEGLVGRGLLERVGRVLDGRW